MRQTIRPPLLLLLSGLMIMVGVMHFANPDPFVKIMPGYLPWHLELVYLSGVFEILGGVGLLVPKTRRLAAWGLIALYVAVFPANVNMAVNNIALGDVPNPLMAWARLPLQLVLIAWAWRYTRPARAEN